MDWLPIVFVAVFLGAIGAVTGALAKRKGYEFWSWFFAGGVIGLIALSFQPFANGPDLPDIEKRARTEKGNRLGRRLAFISLGLVLIRVIASG